MKVPVRLNDVTKDTRIVYLEESQFGFLDEWRESLGDDTNPIRIDAVNFATLACKRFSAHSAFENYARDIAEIADFLRDNPYSEVANLVALTADWFPGSRILGLAHFRRTWSNNLILDYLAVYPLIARRSGDSPLIVRGVGTALLFFLCSIARRYECGSIWGEATQNSCDFYQKVFNLNSVKDLLYIPRRNIMRFLAALEQNWKSER